MHKRNEMKSYNEEQKVLLTMLYKQGQREYIFYTHTCAQACTHTLVQSQTLRNLSLTDVRLEFFPIHPLTLTLDYQAWCIDDMVIDSFNESMIDSYMILECGFRPNSIPKANSQGENCLLHIIFWLYLQSTWNLNFFQ